MRVASDPTVTFTTLFGMVTCTTLTWPEKIIIKKVIVHTHILMILFHYKALSMTSFLQNPRWRGEGKRNHTGKLSKQLAWGRGIFNNFLCEDTQILCDGEVIALNWEFLLCKDGLEQRFLKCHPGTHKSPWVRRTTNPVFAELRGPLDMGLYILIPDKSQANHTGLLGLSVLKPEKSQENQDEFVVLYLRTFC